MHSPDKKNIVICGYQKSGTIWATRLIAELLQCPSVGYWGYPEPYSVTEGTNRKSNFACFQSHHSHEELSQLEPTKIHKLIYLVRDPRDIWLSGTYHFHFERYWFIKFASLVPSGVLKTTMKKLHQKLLSPSYKKQRMLDMLFYGDTQTPHAHWSWQRHIESHMHNKKMLLIRYEDLLHDGLNTCKQILAHIGVHNHTDAYLNKCISNQSFEKRKSEFKDDKEKVKYRHLRKGLSGDWKNHLSPVECEALSSKLGAIMKTLGYLKNDVLLSKSTRDV